MKNATHFVERIGAKVIRLGLLGVPSLKLLPKITEDSVIHSVSEQEAATKMPAYWTENEGVKEVPDPPSKFYDFDYETLTWVLDQQRAWKAVRKERDALIAATDWRVTRSLEQGDHLPTAWAVYRQQLRDVTNQASPIDIIWPIPPDA